MKKKRSGKQYLVCDEYDHSKPFNTRTEAVRECAIWRKEGRNAEVIRRIPEHLAARPAAIIPRFYERSADQVFNHLQPVDTSAAEEALRRSKKYQRGANWEDEQEGRWSTWVEREPELEQLTLSPQELWMEHRGWSA